MNRAVKVQGIECPIIRKGNNLVDIVVDTVLSAIDIKEIWHKNGDDLGEPIIEHTLNDKDIIGITESVVARAAGQYITVDDVAADIEKKFGKDATICLVSPIYSRNRFSMILKGIARAAKKVIIVMPEYDEVGNPVRINPFTGVDIEQYYMEICASEKCDCKTYFNSLVREKSNAIIDCRLHTNYEKPLEDKQLYNIFYNFCDYRDVSRIISLKDICSDKSQDWGVLGTNKATEEKLKLFPSKVECQRVCEEVKAKIKEKTGKDIIVCIYGDGCFKDPVGGIWEFADPVTMPGYTDKELMESSPNELKFKYIIDTLESDAEIEYTLNADKSKRKKDGKMGTTPRLYRDLLASLMDLTSGSGDRCTPVVLIQNYF